MSLAGVRLFARVGFPNLGPRGLLLVFKGYLDRSVQAEGGHRIAVLAGLVAPEYRWIRFEAEWKSKILDRHKICAFEWADCIHGTEQFAGWPRPRLEGIRREAVAIVRKWHTFGISAAVVVNDFEELTRGSSRKHPYTKSPYALCFYSSVAFIIHELRKRHVPAATKTALYFDREEKVSQLIQNYWNSYLHERDSEERILSATPGTKCQFVPIQAADILAYETAQRFLRWLDDPNRSIRRSLRALGDNSKLSIQYFHKDNLAPIIEAMKTDGVF